jgi:hypothetical protein
MTLNLIKLCVGVSEIEEMQSWVKLAKNSKEELDHVTRMFPRRKDEVLHGGSLYWVIRGLILCRQPIADLQEVVGLDGISRCRIFFAPQIILVRPTPRRAFQGWRYLLAEDSPVDLPRGEKPGDISDKMRRELAALGLI